MESKKAFAFVTSYYAPGYGAASPKVFQAIELVKKTEGIQLDQTYSGKAMSYVINNFRGRLGSKQPMPKVLFWDTYNSYDLMIPIKAHHWENQDKPWLDLPKDFWPLFRSAR